MTTPTHIETFEDILAAMENNPRLQAAMRQHVLDQEFLQLPAIVRELQQAVQELQQAIAQLTQLVYDYIAATDARLEQIESRLDRLESGQARLEQDVTELKTGQARLEQDVTELKTGQARLEQDVTELKTGQARLEQDVTELKTGQARLEQDVTELKTGQARLEGNVNRLIGSDYERKAARRASRLANRHLGMADMRVIYAVTMPDNNQLPQILDNAVRAGRLNASEADALEEIDIVIRGPSGYAVAEVSVTLDETDVQRAQERAGLLSKAVTDPVRAAVIGAHTLDSASRLAATNNVAIMILPE